MMSVVQVALNAIPAVQAFTREEQEHALFQSHAADTVAAYKEATLADMWFKFFVGLVTAIGTAAIMWIGAQAVLDGRITVGTILVFLAYLASLYGPLNSITYTASTLQYAAANAERVVEILHTPLDVRDLPDARDVKLRGHVCYENVVFGYEPAQSVLKGISFEAKPGEIVASVGRRGEDHTGQPAGSFLRPLVGPDHHRRPRSAQSAGAIVAAAGGHRLAGPLYLPVIGCGQHRLRQTGRPARGDHGGGGGRCG
jgi:ABC-type multidrug transport system fused ATPase/permease subunit